MSLNAKEQRTNSSMRDNTPPLEPDTYPGRLVQVVTLGLQKQQPFRGQEKAPVREIQLTYELSDEFMLDEEGEPLKDKPRWLSETMPFYSLGAEKAKSTL